MTDVCRDALACEHGRGESHRQVSTITPPGRGVAATTDWPLTVAMLRCALNLWPVT